MTEENNYYLIDSDAASKLHRGLLETPFFQNQCRLTEENIYELRENNNIDCFSKHEIKINSEILLALPDVWDKVDYGDKIFDLYQNEGNADLIIIATLLFELKRNKSRLFSDDWVIVSDDKGLTAVAEKFSFSTMTSDDFMKFTEDNKLS